MELLSKLKNAFKKTSDIIAKVIPGKSTISEEIYNDLEDALIQADVGVQTAKLLIEKLKSKKISADISVEDVQRILAEEISELVRPYECNSLVEEFDKGPRIILVVGVNGTGKTTSIAKLAAQIKSAGKSCLMIAGDTFRAAAVEQLKCWGDKLNIEVFYRNESSDAAGLIFDGIKKAQEEKIDFVLIDTAGRMQNRDDLIGELEKIKKVIKKLDPSAPHHTILALDGLIGQSSTVQTEVFFNRIGIDRLIVTKLDSSAKGGMIISLTQKYKIPVLAIGIGEGIEDLQKFSAEDYSKALVGFYD